MHLPDIDEQIYYHFTRGGGLAAQIRDSFHYNGYQNWLKDLEAFFDARIDLSRILAARHVSDMLLRRHNMQYLVPLIDIVAELELKRLTNYQKQSDHTIHCLYLYLLGVTIFDNSKALQRAYEKVHLGKKCLSAPDLRSGFSLSWIIASMLHDIGYIFDNISTDTLKARGDLDRLFDVQKINNLALHFPNAAKKTLSQVGRLIEPAVEDWRKASLLPTYSICSSPLEVLAELDKCPWMKDLFTELTASTALFLYEQSTAAGEKPVRKPGGRYISKYADFVARRGYFGDSEGCVDHGYASGCLVMQLTGLRYWIIDRVKLSIEKKASSANLLDDLAKPAAEARHPGFGYHKYLLLSNISTACHASACHNVLPAAIKYKKNLPFRLNNSVILFLSSACDELQKWHRPPIGDRLISRPFTDVPLSATSFWLGWPANLNDEFLLFGIGNRAIASAIVDAVYAKVDRDDLSVFIRFSGEAGKYCRDLDLMNSLGISKTSDAKHGKSNRQGISCTKSRPKPKR